MVTALKSVAALAVALALCTGFAHAGILDDVKQRKALRCGVNPEFVGFSVVDDAKQWSGFDVDYCRAIAAAVLGDGTKVTFVPLTTKERFNALQSGDVDVLIRDTAWTMGRDTAFGLTFAGVNFHNGLGFMVPRSLGVTSALQLTGAKVCVERGSAAEVAVTQYFGAHNMAYTVIPVADAAAEKTEYEAGNCNAYTSDLATLYGVRLSLTKPEDSAVLPELLAKEPYGPVVLQDDPQWIAIVRWVHFALLNAEELGVTSQNVDAMLASPNEDIRNLLGTNGKFGEGIGLGNDWAAAAIRAVGNYGEIFDRNLGAKSKLQMPRGLNALWTEGGLQFAPPIR